MKEPESLEETAQLIDKCIAALRELYNEVAEDSKNQSAETLGDAPKDILEAIDTLEKIRAEVEEKGNDERAEKS